MCDLTIDRRVARHFASYGAGLDMLLLELERRYGRRLELYSLSTEWLRDESITVLKARGVNGDLLVKLV